MGVATPEEIMEDKNHVIVTGTKMETIIYTNVGCTRQRHHICMTPGDDGSQYWQEGAEEEVRGLEGVKQDSGEDKTQMDRFAKKKTMNPESSTTI